MDGAVGRHEAIDGGGVVEVEHGLGERAQPLELRGRDLARGGRRGGRLEQEPQVVDLAHVAQGQRRDDVAAARLGQHQPLDAQARERGADRRLGEAEARDELGLGDGAPGASSSRMMAWRKRSWAAALEAATAGSMSRRRVY